MLKKTSDYNFIGFIKEMNLKILKQIEVVLIIKI